MNDFDPYIAATFVVYLILVLLLGLKAFNRTHSVSAYVLGDRGLGSSVTALSAQASDMSGWLLLGLPGFAYASGLESLWLVLGLFLGTYMNWRLVAARLRTATEHYGNALTLPDYLQNRFQDSSGLLRIVSALFILFFFMFYTSSGLVAGGKLFDTVFGLPYQWAVVTGAAVIVLYTMFGGFLAVSWTDAFQGTLMFFALLLVAVLALAGLGGITGAWDSIQHKSPALLDIWTNAKNEPLGPIAIASLLAWGLGYFGQPHILARFMAIRSADEISTARRIAMAWVTTTLLTAVVIGIAGIGLVQSLSNGDSERIFMDLAALLLHPIPAGICLAAILAAIMSTADSQLLVASTALVEDLYRPLLRKNADEKERILVGRLGVLLVAVGAVTLAMDSDSKVLDLVAYAWAVFGAAFGPVILFSLFLERMNRASAIAGIVTGGITVVIWKQLSGGLFDLYELLPGFLLASAVIVVMNLGRKGNNTL